MPKTCVSMRSIASLNWAPVACTPGRLTNSSGVSASSS